MKADALIDRVRELPPLPRVLTEVLLALQRDDVAVDQLSLKISQDEALAAKTLRLANCSFYGVAGRVGSIRDGINVLGLRTLSGALAAAAVAGRFPRIQCEGFDFDAHWRHSIGSALCAQAIARVLQMDEATAFTAALVHDIGRLALASHFPGEFAQTLHYQAEHDCLTHEAEQAVLGTDHCELGACIAEHWCFAVPVILAIRQHHAPQAQGPANLVDLVHVADNIAHGLDLSGLPSEAVPPLSVPTWMRLGLSAEQCREIFERVEQELDGLCNALNP